MRKFIIYFFLCVSSTASAQECNHIKLEDIQECAKNGNSFDQHLLGMLYLGGGELPRNYSKSFEWFSKAANQGNKDAQAELGFSYYNGWGVKRDKVMAYMWWSLSVINHQDRITQINIEELEATLSPEDLTRAQDLATKWFNNHQKKK